MDFKKIIVWIALILLMQFSTVNAVETIKIDFDNDGIFETFGIMIIPETKSCMVDVLNNQGISIFPDPRINRYPDNGSFCQVVQDYENNSKKMILIITHNNHHPATWTANIYRIKNKRFYKEDLNISTKNQYYINIDNSDKRNHLIVEDIIRSLQLISNKKPVSTNNLSDKFASDQYKKLGSFNSHKIIMDKSEKSWHLLICRFYEKEKLSNNKIRQWADYWFVRKLNGNKFILIYYNDFSGFRCPTKNNFSQKIPGMSFDTASKIGLLDLLDYLEERNQNSDFFRKYYKKYNSEEIELMR